MMKQSITLITAVAFLAACSKDDDQNNEPDPEFGNGVFITNEGPFQSGSGTLSFYDVNSEEVQNNVFEDRNDRPLGNIVHSIHRHEGNLYVVVNNAGVVEIISDKTGNTQATLHNFTAPRYVLGINSEQIAVTDWGTNSVRFQNPYTGGVQANVQVGEGPERMVLHNDRLYVANSGAFGIDSTVHVIDVTNYSVIDTLWVGHNPNSLVIDAGGDLWVLCAGINDWSEPSNNTPGSLHRIDPATGTEINHFDFASSSTHPGGLTVNTAGDELYFISDPYGGEPYRMSTGAAALPATPLLSKAFYALGYDPHRDELYLSDPVDFASDGWIFRYDLNGQAVTDSFQAGIIPGNFEFR